MIEKNWLLIEKIIKIIAPCIPIIAVIIGLYQFESGQRKLKALEYDKIFKNDSLRTEQRLLEKKIEVYSKISESFGAILAHDSIDSVFKSNVDTFEKIYYGEALLIVDSSVDSILKKFKVATQEYMNGDLTLKQLKYTGFILSDSIKSAIWRKTSVYH